MIYLIYLSDVCYTGTTRGSPCVHSWNSILKAYQVQYSYVVNISEKTARNKSILYQYYY